MSVRGDVIDWENYPGKENDVVWQHPSKEINWGSALIVKEFEAAAFFRDGKIYDVFGPGRHVLTTNNLPLLKQSLKLFYNDTLFQSTVIFASQKEFTGLFGARSQTKELFPILSNGQFWYKISDPNLFINEVVGGNQKFSTSDVSDFLKSFVNQNIMKEIANFSLDDVFTSGLDAISLKTKTSIYDKFARFGVDLFDLKFSQIDTEDRYRELAAMVKQGVSADKVLEMYTLRESAKELGKSTGGAALGAGLVLPQMAGQMQQPPKEQKEGPLDVLKRRFAKGEINKKEYEARKKVLEED